MRIFALLLYIFLTSCGLMNINKSNIDDSFLVENNNIYYTKTENKKIGILLPLSGRAKMVGNSILNSIQLALFNEKADLDLKIYDTQGTTFGAVNAMEQASKDGVIAIIGPLFSPSVKAIKKIASESGIIVLSLSNDDSLKNLDNIYLMGFSPEQEIERVVSYLISNGYFAFSAIVKNNTYGSRISHSLKSTVQRKDARVVKLEFLLDDDPNINEKTNNIITSYAIPDRVYEQYEQDLTRAKMLNEKEKVKFQVKEEDKIFSDVILIGETSMALSKISNIIKTRYKKVPNYKLIGLSSWDNPSIYSNSNLDGALFATNYSDNYIKYQNSFEYEFGNFPNKISTLGYDAILVLDEVLSKGSYYETKKELLRYDGFDGLTGKFRFLQNGIVERKLSIAEIKNNSFEIIDEDQYEFLRY